MPIVYFIRLAKGIIYNLFDAAQCVRHDSECSVYGLLEPCLIIYKRPCQKIQNIPAHFDGQLIYSHGRICHNPDQVGGCLLPILSTKYRENVCHCLRKISLNPGDLCAHVKHGHKMLLDPLFVLIQILVETANQIRSYGDSYACYRACLLPQ